MNKKIEKRLKELKKAIEDENISYGELVELQSLKDYIKDDIVLKEWAGIPEDSADNPIRKKAIRILEAIAEKFGNPEMFDSVQEMDEPDGTWYEYEDMIVDILTGKDGE